MKENYISEEMLSVIKNKYSDYFKIKDNNNDIWLQRSIILLEIYIPVLKYNILNKKIECNSLEKLNQLIESYSYLDKLNILSINEYEKFEKFLYHLPGFNIQEYKNYKNYNTNISSLNHSISAFENFGYVEMQIIEFLKNTNTVNDIVLLEEKKRINEILESF